MLSSHEVELEEQIARLRAENAELVATNGDLANTIGADNLSLRALNAELVVVLTDIGNGNVPPELCFGATNPTDISFRLKMLEWAQKTARAALAKARG